MALLGEEPLRLTPGLSYRCSHLNPDTSMTEEEKLIGYKADSFYPGCLGESIFGIKSL
jgi:hypothetical protein